MQRRILLVFVFVLYLIKTYGQCPVISGPTQVCVNTTAYYQVRTSQIGVNNIVWSVSSGSMYNFSQDIGQISFAIPGTYSITATVPGSGCPPTGYTVTVINSSQIAAPIISGPIKVCSGQPSTYSVPPVSGQTVTWLIDDYQISSVADPSPLLNYSANQVTITWPATSKQYTLYAYYSNSSCSGQSGNLPIYLSSGAGPLSISGPAVSCLNSQVQYLATSDQSDNISWSISGGGTISSDKNIAYVNWNILGTNTVFATATNTCNNIPGYAVFFVEHYYIFVTFPCYYYPFKFDLMYQYD